MVLCCCLRMMWDAAKGHGHKSNCSCSRTIRCRRCSTQLNCILFLIAAVSSTPVLKCSFSHNHSNMRHDPNPAHVHCFLQMLRGIASVNPMLAAMTGDLDRNKAVAINMAHFLLSIGANPNIRFVDPPGGVWPRRGLVQGMSALHLAGKAGCMELLELLLQYGADAEVRDVQGRRPLGMLAAGQRSTFRELARKYR